MSKRGRIVVISLGLLPLLAAAGLWARSYWRRDLVTWEAERPESRRATCGLYSSRGRVCFISHSQQLDEPAPPTKGMAWQSGDRASTVPLADLVRNQLQQAGVLDSSQVLPSYSQYVGAMSSGTHVWTGMVVPWWVVTALAVGPPVYAIRVTRRKAAPDDEAPPAASPT
jgi:hypothetical protein